MAKKEIWDKVTWQEREIRKKKERKNESIGKLYFWHTYYC